ncbi:hypothetical protein E4U57_001281 [Claviceps arundinis]|uniref:Uncharacterized protein n=1 Tax=Claviceps arundinis TaxID=1623583 RepID=A0ABQ7PAW9_9HYPO|nr:hypothetical protein E4U57_001281 [Claviceps arundinis]
MVLESFLILQAFMSLQNFTRLRTFMAYLIPVSVAGSSQAAGEKGSIKPFCFKGLILES